MEVVDGHRERTDLLSILNDMRACPSDRFTKHGLQFMKQRSNKA